MRNTESGGQVLQRDLGQRQFDADRLRPRPSARLRSFSPSPRVWVNVSYRKWSGSSGCMFVADHDRAGSAGQRIGVAHHPAQCLQIDPAGLSASFIASHAAA